MLSRPLRSARFAVVVRAAVSLFVATCIGTLAGPALAQTGTVSVGAPSNVLSNATASSTFPVTISRASGPAVLGFSVTFTRSSNLSLPAGNSSIVLGGFLGASGATGNLQVRDLGGGQYAADGVTLGMPCGSTALTGTLFTIEVASADAAGTGTITIDQVLLRDCSNAPIASAIGTAGSVTIDHTNPVVSLTSPVGGESWLAGSSHAITWTASDPELGPNPVSLEHSSNGGSSWSTIASGLANSGSYAWTVPATTGTQQRVRITVSDANANSATASSADFTIQGTSATALTSTPNYSIFGASVALDATVTFTPPGSGAGDGTVTFYDDGAALQTLPLVSGGATLNTSALAVGVHPLTASYSGDVTATGSTSSIVSHEVKAQIVATAGANGSISPAGTTVYSLNATPAFTFAADPGYHVASVTVDGSAVALTSPYTFAPVSANHTIDVQFAVNPPVPALTALTATTLRTGQGPSGTMRVQLTWEPIAAGSSVAIYRAGYGNHPEYNGTPSPGSVPAVPSYPPPAPWALVTGTTGTSMLDTTAPRDFVYYVAFVVDVYGTISPVSNRTNGTLTYALGDVSNGVTAGAGDNLVNLLDISLLGSQYGRVLTPGDSFNYLDVGPTTDHSVLGRPVTDDRVNFEDLIMFGLNFDQVSAPASRATPAAAARDELALAQPARVEAGEEFEVRLVMRGTGAVHGVSAALEWDAAVVAPVAVHEGAAVAGAGIALSPAPGAVDVVAYGAEGPGFTGDAELAIVRFRALRSGAPDVRLARADARDAANRSTPVALLAPAATRVPEHSGFQGAAPSPFRDRTTLTYALAQAEDAELAVFSVDGRRVRLLASGPHEAGEYRVGWDGRDDAGQPAAAGLYFVRLKTHHKTWSHRITYIR